MELQRSAFISEFQHDDNTYRAALTVTFVSDITAMLSHDFGAAREKRARTKKKLGEEQNRNVKKKTLVRTPAKRALHVQLSQPHHAFRNSHSTARPEQLR